MITLLKVIMIKVTNVYKEGDISYNDNDNININEIMIVYL